MIDMNVFLTNLSATCTGNKLLREDGKHLTVFNRITDLFRSKHNYQHFVSVCQKLSEACNDGSIHSVTAEQGIEILGRLREIYKTLRNEPAKQECNGYIKTIEDSLMEKESVNELCTAIWQDVKAASITRSKQNLHRDIRKLDAILDYYRQDTAVIHTIAEQWLNLSAEVKPDFTARAETFYRKANNEVIKLLLTREEASLKEGINDSQDIMQLYLTAEYAKTNPDRSAIKARIKIMTNLMDKHPRNTAFITRCLQNIDLLLAKEVFTSKSSLSLSEYNLRNLLRYSKFFPIIERHLPACTNKKIVYDLKVKFANLPCRSHRSSYPNLLLTEKEQLEILITGLQKQEDDKVDSLIRFLQDNSPLPEAIPRLAKLIDPDGGLSKENVEKLRSALEKRVGPLPDKAEEKKKLIDFFIHAFSSEKTTETGLIYSLKRITKAKALFANQLELNEDMILIPRWYHASRRRGCTQIIGSGEIQVRHEGVYEGAWISSYREEEFGTHVFALSSKVSHLDRYVRIETMHPYRRWRGIRKAIPLKKHIMLVGVPHEIDKTVKKTEKLRIVQILQEKGFPGVQVASVRQVDFVNSEVLRLLGTPNLSLRWWGK